MSTNTNETFRILADHRNIESADGTVLATS